VVTSITNSIVRGRQDRAGVEDQVDPLVELEPLAVLDVGRALLGPAGRVVADGQAQGQAPADGVGVLEVTAVKVTVTRDRRGGGMTVTPTSSTAPGSPGGCQASYQLQRRCRRVDGEAISVLCNTWLATTRDGRPLHLDGQGRPRFVVRQLVDLREGRRPEDQLASATPSA
jgi:hypothetical protein